MRKTVGSVAARITIVAVIVAISALSMLAGSPMVYANGGSNNTITVTPSSGPVGVNLALDMNVTVSTTTIYQLSGTTFSPDQGGCANAQPLVGVGPVSVDPPLTGGGGQGGTVVSIQWPANLGRGQYWLCAQPTSGDGHAISSAHPFTVLTDAAPSVLVAPPPGKIDAGTVLRVTVSNWILPDHSAPLLSLLYQGNTVAQAVSVQSNATAVSSDSSTGVYIFTVRLPSVLGSGSYALISEGLCASNACAVVAQSSMFVVSSAASLATNTSSRSGISRVGAWLTDPRSLPLKVGIALLLLLIAIFSVIPLVRRARRHDANRRPHGNTPRQYRQW